MTFPRVTAFSGPCGRLVLAAAGLVLGATAEPALAEHPATTLATLLDRAQIEDLLVDYYNRLGHDENSFGTYYVPDGVLDVNGLVAQGEKPIAELYKKLAAGSPHLKGTFHMVLSNPIVVINGDTATADVLWTGVISETVQAAPRLVEQGREHDELVKRDGRWFFKHRVITSDGGLQPMFEKLYKVR
jgi:SnoaL-like protein